MSDLNTEQSRASGGVSVELRELTVRAGGRILLESASASFAPGEVTLIVGRSGAGKSLLLRTIAGLLDIAQGEVDVAGRLLINDRDALHRSRSSHPPVGVVFQNFALFDELSPAANVRFAYAHRNGRVSDSSAGRETRPDKLLDELNVPRGVPTAALSGGQRQRLAIARTLAYNPDVILYDEPTSGLDPVTAVKVARLIQQTQAAHRKTSIIVTHDYESLAPIADHIYLLDAASRSLRAVDRRDWPRLHELLEPPAPPATAFKEPAVGRTSSLSMSDKGVGRLEARPTASDATAAARVPPSALARGLRTIAASVPGALLATSHAIEQVLALPVRMLPIWKSVAWGLRFFAHYLRLVAGPSAWLYVAIAGAIAGFVATYFTFRFMPYRSYTEPLVIENMLNALGFSLYRILVPVLATVLIAARCGAAVASDVGGKVYGQQTDALRSFGVNPARYLGTGILYAFLLGTPLLVAIAFVAARVTSVLVFTASHPRYGPFFWETHFHRELIAPGEWLYRGTGWLAAKVLVCAAGIALVAYDRGRQPKRSTKEVSLGITSTILWSTLLVLVVHFAFAFVEFEN
jgi:ABC-type transporter Mla maintaining outer membrane lipid asymmetry ATPase subunit MlaF/ABC-type transporter Mla maintaining outer membrane lipid asymmetry permease subunit MlaE